MMKNVKMNDKGRLLAIIAVFAMVFAGAAVVMASEDADATSAIENPKVITTKEYALTADDFKGGEPEVANYYNIIVDGVNAKIAVSALTPGADASVTYNVFLANGGSLTFSEASLAKFAKIVVRDASKDAASATTYIAGTDTVTYDAADAAIAVKAMKVAQKTIGSGTTASSLLYVSSNADEVPEFTASTAGVYAAGKLTTAKAVANLNAAYVYARADGGAVTYGETVTKNLNFSPSADTNFDTLTVNPGNDITTTIKITYNGASTTLVLSEADIETALVIEIRPQAAPSFDAGKLTDGSITLSKGYADIGTQSDNFNAGTLRLIAASDGATASTERLAHQLLCVKTGETTYKVFNYVYGDLVQTSSVDFTKAETKHIVVGEDDALTINEGVTVKVGKTGETSTAIAGTVTIFGALVDADETATITGTGYIGPVGYTNFTAATDKLKNVASVGKAFEINRDVIEDTIVGSAVIGSDGITINAGHSLTVNGDLGLNGHKLVVYGKLIVKGSVYSTGLSADSVTVDENIIIIGPTGDVDVDKNMAVNTYVGIKFAADATVLDPHSDNPDIIMRGVNGLDYYTAKDGDATVPAISGTVEKDANSYADVEPTVYVLTGGSPTDAMAVTEPLVISSGVTMILGDERDGSAILRTSASGNIEINGFVASGVAVDAMVFIGNGTNVSVNGLVVGVVFNAYNGLVLDDHPFVLPVTIDIQPGITEQTIGDNTVYYRTYVSGFSISVDQVKEGTDTVQRILIDGDLSVGTSDVKVEFEPGDESEVAKPSLVFGSLLGGAYTIHVAEGDELIIPSTIDVIFGGDGTEIVTVVEGLIKSAGKLVDDSGNDAPYIGGHYSIEAGTPKTETHYYEPLDKALDAISLAKNKTVDASVGKIDFDITIGEGQTLRLVREGTRIDSDATVTIENGGKQTDKAFAKILGLFINKNGGTIVTPEEDAYCVMTTNEDGDVIYAGFDGANARSQPGETLVIGDGEAGGNVVMYNGRNYVITGTLQVPGDFTVEEGAIVTVDGGTILFKGEKTHNLAVEGLLDADQGSIAKDGDATKNKINAAVTGLGFLSLVSIEDVNLFDAYNGAGYESADGYVLTSIDLAVVSAPAAGISEEVTIFGNVVWVADLEISKVVIVFYNDKAVLNFAGTVTLDEATIDVKNGTFTGTVTADTIVLGSATAEFTAVKGTLKIADDVGLTLSGDLTAGIVSLESGITYFGDLTLEDAMIMVGEGAAAHVHGETRINKGIFAISGNVIVDDGGRLMLIGGINTVLSTGSLIAQKTETAGSIEIATLRVLGTLKNDGGNVNVNANPSTDGGLFIGAEPTSLGAANGTIAGDITSGVGGGNIIMIYAGADFDEMKIDGAATYKATVFMINGVEYQFLVSSGAADITDNVLAASDYDLPGYEGTAALKTKAGWDFGTASPKVGTPALVTATLEKSTADVTVSPIKGMSIVVDGVTYKNTTEAELKVGEHTLSFTLDPGYKIKDGSSVTMTFNGVKVTNSIIITPGMVGQDLILAASGDIVIDQEIPEQEKQDDTVIIILLAILVVMVVILAIVTILRMMRS